MSAIIETTGLTKSYRGRPALHGVDLELPSGKIHALLGPNGAGKTTLVSILSTLISPDAGSARVAGYDVVRQASGVRGVIGFAGQYAAIEPKMTGRENLRMFGRLSGLSRRDAARAAEDSLESLGLSSVASRRAGTYSGGTRRRLDLAVSLVARPVLLLLDEPSSGLDPLSRRRLWDAVRDLAARGTNVLLTTQYLEEAEVLADQVIVLRDGTVAAQGSPMELKARVGSETVTVSVERLEMLSRVAAELNTESRIDEATMSVSWTSKTGGADALRIFTALAEAGIAVTGLTVQHPTLDDVFVDLVAAPHREQHAS